MSVASAAAWPLLPEDPGALAELIAARARRTDAPRPPLDATSLRAALRAGVDRGAVAAGYPAIVAALEGLVREARARSRPAYFLFGTHHDAGAQVEAFRRIVGTTGMQPRPVVAVELFQADGAWAGRDLGAQSGDDAPLTAFAAQGDAAALALLRAAQLAHDYTAYKYGYIDAVLDLAVDLRALGRRLVACDMPSALQRDARTGFAGDGALVERLRDVHCTLALERALATRADAEPEVVALFYGDAHLEPERLPRLLPANAVVVSVHLVGGRAGDVGVEAELGGLELVDPLLIPLSAADAGEAASHDYALVLAQGKLAARSERVRAPADGDRPSALVVTGDAAELRLAGTALRLDGAPHELARPHGRAVFLLVAGPRLVAGGIEVPERGAAALELESDGTVRLTERGGP